MFFNKFDKGQCWIQRSLLAWACHTSQDSHPFISAPIASFPPSIMSLSWMAHIMDHLPPNPILRIFSPIDHDSTSHFSAIACASNMVWFKLAQVRECSHACTTLLIFHECSQPDMAFLAHAVHFTLMQARTHTYIYCLTLTQMQCMYVHWSY
jgi:hypothetical protein